MPHEKQHIDQQTLNTVVKVLRDKNRDGQGAGIQRDGKKGGKK